jgi:hypothetical protein
MTVGDGRSFNQTGSDSDLLLYYLTTSGKLRWTKHFGGILNESAYSHIY